MSGKLLRVLGVGFGLAVIVGNTIGAGIVRTPGDVAAQLPNELLFLGVWALGGAYALLGSVSIVELATMIPRAGGQYAFSHRALGPYAGFVVGWSDWLSTCGTTAAVSIVIGEYTVALAPSLAGKETAIAAAVTVFFALLQWRGIKWGDRTQQVTSLFKAIAFAALIAACFLFGGGKGGAAVAPAPLPQGYALLAAVVVALQAMVYTYDGWAGVTYFSEEVRDPGRDIPRSTFLGVLAVMAIYVLLNAALVYVLPMDKIAGNQFAPGVAMAAIFGPRGEQALRVLLIISMLSGINAYHLMATRTLFAMSRDRLGPRAAVRVNRGGTPSVALFVSMAVALVFLLRTFSQVIAVLAFFFVINYTLSFVSLFVLRKREPDAYRPYRAWGYPWTTALSLVVSVAFLAGSVAGDRENSPYMVGLLALSYPVYRLIRRSQPPPAQRHGPRKRRKRARK
jgi:APA family basic amino acid/polyamine antiporter